jgi:3'(2'), 5'-bisphosphate nucleotidase
MNLIPLIEPVLSLSIKAGEAILDIYNGRRQGEFRLKEDDTPLTLADQASHRIISSGLAALTPDIPCLSEEGSILPYEIRKHWDYFWCVDPLDGTKEFLQRNGEFTVNIALIHRHKPVLGVIYIPANGTLYYGTEATGGWKRSPDGNLAPLRADNAASQWTAVRSRSHASEAELEMLKTYPVSAQIAAGSSLKFCLIAEGLAHFYYRHGPTMEWDTAAGHVIVECSGGLLTAPSGDPFLYNKPSLTNGPFICRIVHPGT